MCHEMSCGYYAFTLSGTRWHHHVGCCCFPGYERRRFPTREEVIGELEEYLKQLQAEVKGVEERIAKLRKAT